MVTGLKEGKNTAIEASKIAATNKYCYQIYYPNGFYNPHYFVSKRYRFSFLYLLRNGYIGTTLST